MTEPRRYFDEILTTLKTGKWNLIHFFGLSLGGFLVPSLVLAGSFLSPTVEFTCKPPPGQGSVTEINDCNYVVEQPINLTGQLVNQTLQCTEWEFEKDLFNNTLTSEFNLECNHAYLRPTYQTVYMLGNFIGSPIFGMLSDRCGRKSLFVAGIFLAITSVLASSFATNFKLVLILRFITGLAHPPLIQTAYILAMETSEPKLRSVVGIVFSFPWSLGTMWWGVLGYLIKDWRWLQRVSIVPAFIFIVCFMSFIDESVRWLIVRGEHDRALATLKKAARMNKSSLPPDEELLSTMKLIQKTAITKTDNHELKITRLPVTLAKRTKNFFAQILILYKTPELRKRILLMYTVFIVSSTVFYGIALNAVNFQLNPFMYMIVSGLMEAPAYSVSAPIVARLGRVLPTILSFMICGVTILVLGFIPTEIKWLVITLAMSGKYFISSAYQIIYLISSEAFPTEIRLQALGTCNFVSRIGSILAPYITDYIGPKYPWFPSVLFGVLSIVAGVAAIFIPETLNTPLPETIQQLEQEASKRKIKWWHNFKDKGKGEMNALQEEGN